MKFVVTKKAMTINFFSPFSFVAGFGSGIEILDPGWVKIIPDTQHCSAEQSERPVPVLDKGPELLMILQ